jgi:hypothetical protein
MIISPSVWNAKKRRKKDRITLKNQPRCSAAAWPIRKRAGQIPKDSAFIIFTVTHANLNQPRLSQTPGNLPAAFDGER